MAGATLSKGLNRAIGTVLGGGLGCLAAGLAEQVGGIGDTIIVGISVFIFGKSLFLDMISMWLLLIVTQTFSRFLNRTIFTIVVFLFIRL